MLPKWLSGEETRHPANIGDAGLIPGSGRSPGEGNGNPLRYSYLGNPMDRGSWVGYSPRGHKESDTAERLSGQKRGFAWWGSQEIHDTPEVSGYTLCAWAHVHLS